MKKICSAHLAECVHKEGVSKTTGKEYSFWACPEKVNGEYCKAEVIDAPVTEVKTEKTDWEAISRGKVRHGVVVALIQNGGLEALKGNQEKITRVVEYIMSGEIVD